MGADLDGLNTKFLPAGSNAFLTQEKMMPQTSRNAFAKKRQSVNPSLPAIDFMSR